MPAVGFGVFQTPSDVTTASVEQALEAGYRLIDTAAAYLNEREVGAAVAASGVERSELFVQTKLWISDYGHDEALHAFDVSARKLALDYLDLYLLHQPLPSDFDATVASYLAAEELLAEGRVRAIGVCNFDEKLLERLIERTNVVPAVNQVEVHPYFAQPALRAAHARLGIQTQAWSPLGGILRYRPDDPTAVHNALEDPVIVGIASKHSKTAAQVVLRWHLEHGTGVVPKSVRRERIAENFDVFDFSLTPGEVAAIDALDTGVRAGPEPETVDAMRTAFRIPD
jgi:diketogulonate reductase-like aldo/keto reductase